MPLLTESLFAKLENKRWNSLLLIETDTKPFLLAVTNLQIMNSLL